MEIYIYILCYIPPRLGDWWLRFLWCGKGSICSRLGWSSEGARGGALREYGGSKREQEAARGSKRQQEAALSRSAWGARQNIYTQ